MSRRATRKKRLVDAGLQLHLVGSLVGMSLVAMLLQFLFLGARLVSVLGEVEGPGGQLADEVPGILLQVFAGSVAVLVPIVFFLGIVLTQRIAGPVHRFRTYLAAVTRGEAEGPCQIRRGDQLQELCDAINEATAPLLRESATEPAGRSPLRASA